MYKETGPMNMRSSSRPSLPPMPIKPVAIGVGALIAIFLLVQLVEGMTSMWGYWQYPVGSNQVAIRFVRNAPVEVLGPGVYTDFSPFNWFEYKSIQTVNVSGLRFNVTDAEVLTKDRQRLGVLITGTVLRPGVAESKQLLDSWSTYRNYYLDDKLLIGPAPDADHPYLMAALGSQAAKVCVGDANFNDAVVGSARDVLRECIEREFGVLAKNYGLTVTNVVVPNIILSKPVQDQLDAITQARLAKDVADQRGLQNAAEAEANAAKERGAIQVEQAKVQEKAKQDALTAQLQTQALEAQRQQIEAQKNNDLYTAQRDQEINQAALVAAQTKAQADIASQVVTARMYQDNPAFAHYQEVVAMASAYGKTDKVLTLPNNSNPIAVLSDTTPGQVIVQASPQSASSAPPAGPTPVPGR